MTTEARPGEGRDRRPPVRRRATASRVLATGVSASVAIGLMGTMQGAAHSGFADEAADDAAAVTVTSAAPATRPPVTRAPETVIVIVEVDPAPAATTRSAAGPSPTIAPTVAATPPATSAPVPAVTTPPRPPVTATTAPATTRSRAS